MATKAIKSAKMTRRKVDMCGLSIRRESITR
jgi:hypothetical protein